MLFRAIVASILVHWLVFLPVQMFAVLPENRSVDASHQLRVVLVAPAVDTTPPKLAAKRPAQRLPLRPSVLHGENKAARVLPHFLPSTVASGVKPESDVADPVNVSGMRQRTPTPEPGSEAAELEAEVLGLYKIGLAREARQFKRYPALARESGWQGIVVVKIQGVAGLVAPRVSLDQASGYAALDQQALEMIVRAVDQVPLPNGLRGLGFSLVLPVHYRLDD